MSKLIVTVLLFVLINSQTTDAQGKIYNSSQVQNRTAIPSTSVPPKSVLFPQNDTHVNSTRKPRFLSGVSFLTGLGLGSIAGATALNDPNFLSTRNYNIISRLTTTTKVPPTDLNVNFGSSEYSPLASIPQPSIYNPSYVLALSTNALVNQTLRSVRQTLQELKAWLIQKDTNSNEQQIVDDIDDEESNNFNVYKVKDNYAVVNYTTLRDIVRASVAEEIAKSNQGPLRQLGRPEESNDSPTVSSSPEETTNSANDTTNSTTPSSTSGLQFDGYYSGQPQNISEVDITLGAYGPPFQQIYPVYPSRPEHYPAPSPPIYGSVSFHQESPPDYYEAYPGHYAGGFTGAGDFYPHYEPYARARKLSSRKSKDLNDFIPSKSISQIL